MDVLSEMDEHLEKFIEAPHELFGGMPICPFSKKYRDQMKRIVCELSAERILSEPLDHLLCWFIDPRKSLPLEELREITAKIRTARPLYEVFDGHPDDTFDLRGVHTHRDPYPSVQLILRSDLAKFRTKLLRTKYYDNFTAGEFFEMLEDANPGTVAEHHFHHNPNHHTD